MATADDDDASPAKSPPALPPTLPPPAASEPSSPSGRNRRLLPAAAAAAAAAGSDGRRARARGRGRIALPAAPSPRPLLAPKARSRCVRASRPTRRRPSGWPGGLASPAWVRGTRWCLRPLRPPRRSVRQPRLSTAGERQRRTAAESRSEPHAARPRDCRRRSHRRHILLVLLLVPLLLVARRARRCPLAAGRARAQRRSPRGGAAARSARAASRSPPCSRPHPQSPRSRCIGASSPRRASAPPAAPPRWPRPACTPSPGQSLPTRWRPSSQTRAAPAASPRASQSQHGASSQLGGARGVLGEGASVAARSVAAPLTSRATVCLRQHAHEHLAERGGTFARARRACAAPPHDSLASPARGSTPPRACLAWMLGAARDCCICIC